MMVESKGSKKKDEALRTLPEDLRPVFEELVIDYQGFAMNHHRMPFVSHVVLADLVREGWRRTAERRE